MAIERPKLSSFLKREGQMYAVSHCESGASCDSWCLQEVTQIDAPPVPDLKNLECFTLLFCAQANLVQGYYELRLSENPEAETHTLFCAPSISTSGKPAMSVVIN